MSRFLIRQLTEKKSPSAGTELVKFEPSTAHSKSSSEDGKRLNCFSRMRARRAESYFSAEKIDEPGSRKFASDGEQIIRDLFLYRPH